MNHRKAEDRPHALTLWTARYDVGDANPNPFPDYPDVTESQCRLVARMSSGVILVRDIPALGPDGLPHTLRRAIIDAGHEFYAVHTGASPLSLFETNIDDTLTAGFLAGRLHKPLVRVVIYTSPTKARSWVDAVQFWKPDAVIGVVSGPNDSVLVPASKEPSPMARASGAAR